MTKTKYNFPSTERHEYDIDVFEILDNLRAKYLSKIDSLPPHLKDLKLIDEEEEYFIYHMTENGIDLSDNIKYRNYILPSSYNIYNTFLGWKILTMDSYKIGPFLTHQAALFQGNHYASKNNFIGLVEFSIYRFVKARNFFNEIIIFENIIDWVERNKTTLINKAYFEGGKFDYVFDVEDLDDVDETIITPEPIAKKESISLLETNILTIKSEENRPVDKIRIIGMDTTFALVFVEKFKMQIQKKDHNKLFDLIINNDFSSPLCFLGNRNQLSEFFKRLRYNKLIFVAGNRKLATWIKDSFVVLDENNKITALKFPTILDVLRRTENEPAKGKRILEDVAQYLSPNKRKTPKELKK